jgi:hypothetical protein
MQNLERIRNLITNGLFFSHHAQEEARSENITLELMQKAIMEGTANFDFCRNNDKSFAWNKKPHIAFSSKGLNLTVIACESLEHGLLVVSVYHGEPHNIYSNPHNVILRGH